MRNRRHNERGVALLLVLFALAISVILAVTFLNASSTSIPIAQNVQRHAEARAIAEGGLEMTINYVRTDGNWRTDQTSGTWLTDQALGGGTFDIAGVDEDDGDLADDSSEPVLLTAIGRFDGVSHRVSAVVTPGAGALGNLLFVVADKDSPNTQDIAKRTLVQGWGWTVTYISASDSPAEFDTAVGENDVVFVTEDINASDLNTKITDASIGIVTEESALYDDLGVSTTDASYTGTTIDVTDNSHYITSPFPTGTLTVGDAALPQKHLGGTIASGVQALAEAPASSNVTLAAIEKGGALYSGGIAAGRRATLPWAGSAFDINDLSADGRTIMKRALEWGAADSGIGIYDYAIRTQGSDIFAYDGQSSTKIPTDNTSPSSVLSGGEYDDLELDDSASHAFGASSNNQYAQTRYVIDIDEAEADVSQFTAMWIGRNVNENNGRTDGAELHIWNYATSGYEQLGVSPDTESEVTLIGVVSANLADYLGGASENRITLLAVSRDRKSGNPNDNTLHTDYLLVTVNAAPAVVAGEPQLIALYEFQPVTVTPQLVGHWKLDEIFSPPGGNLYDYANRTQGTDIFAYSDQSTSKLPSNGTTPGGGSTVLSSNEYDDIEFDDGSEFSQDTASNNRYARKRFEFHLDEAEADVNSIDVTWKGRGVNENSGKTDGAELYIWKDQSPSGWTLLDNSPDTEATVNLSGTITANLPDYISTGDIVSIVVVSADSKSGNPNDNILYTDYVSLTINGSASPPPPASDEVSANDGTYSGGVSSGAIGHGDGGTAAEFDGMDDYIEVPHDSAYRLDNGGVSLWFRSTDVSGRHMIFSKDANTFLDGGHLTIYTDGTTLYSRLQSTSNSYFISTSGIQTNQWYHVVLTWGASGMEMFVNGVSVGDDPYTGGLSTTSGGSGNVEPLAIGASTWNSAPGVATPLNYYFEGRIDDVRIYDQTLNATQVGDLYGGSAPGPGTLPIVYDTGGFGAALDLGIADPDNIAWIAGGGIDVNTDTRFASLTAATKIYSALTATDEFAIEIRFTPANITQDGPANIVSYSTDTTTRNLTFGQDDEKYVQRLRTSDVGSNGTPDINSPDVLQADQQEHVVVSYQNGEVRLYRNGTLEHTEPRTGDLGTWDSSMPLVMVNEDTNDRPWLGKLHRVAIYDLSFNSVQAGNVFNGQPPGDGSAAGFKIVWDENP